ncbi:hypothetical protein [Leucobacter sp. W1478]|uniref:hypothetical protein n=1 Tax=Leucobacter sp. W1478 TaxID=3439065 RepID=UPI003F396EBF
MLSERITMNASEHEDGGGFSEAERAAMKLRADELRAHKGVKGAAKRERELQACIDAIADLPDTDRRIAERFHTIVAEEAPHLDPKTWYGFPSYAADGKVVTFVQPASKFGTRYTTIGFNEDAALDDGPMWATSFAVLDMTAEVDRRLRDLVRRAAA